MTKLGVLKVVLATAAVGVIAGASAMGYGTHRFKHRNQSRGTNTAASLPPAVTCDCPCRSH